MACRCALQDYCVVLAVVPVGKRGQGPAGTLRFGDGEERDVERHTYQYTNFFRDPDNDGWMARQAINDLFVSARNATHHRFLLCFHILPDFPDSSHHPRTGSDDRGAQVHQENERLRAGGAVHRELAGLNALYF